jgi:hypothetical protein
MLEGWISELVKRWDGKGKKKPNEKKYNCEGHYLIKKLRWKEPHKMGQYRDTEIQLQEVFEDSKITKN